MIKNMFNKDVTNVTNMFSKLFFVSNSFACAKPGVKVLWVVAGK